MQIQKSATFEAQFAAKQFADRACHLITSFKSTSSLRNRICCLYLQVH